MASRSQSCIKLFPPKRFLATTTLALITGPLHAITLASCILPTGANLHPYLIRLLEPGGTEMRIGYFGICTGVAPNFKCSVKPPPAGQSAHHVAMAVASRRSVFVPWFTVVAAVLWGVGWVLTVLCQKREKVNIKIDKLTRLCCGLAFWFEFCAAVILYFGTQGILLSLKYAGDGTKVEAGTAMLGTHVALLVLLGILWMVNCFKSSTRGAGYSIGRFFFARFDGAAGKGFGQDGYGQQDEYGPEYAQ
ncbi:hypothetical protein FKW77_003291 [Venturia effusa]|uniref:Uncharacterized protein n=1 Tax=Venturia effusa TaxID=50376 RepID=A0A517L8X8_9PEZI|nr:hypothetical protein FKW77_003291 [Venturia effusa]